jgi:hypothetical protein
MWKLALTVVLLTVLGFQITTIGQTPVGLADWKRFRVAGEHFSILMPALPVVTERGQSGQMPVGIPPFGLPVRKVANSYSAY